MPYINSKVNISITPEQKETLTQRFGESISIIPGKSEQWLMLEFEENCCLYFQGSSEGNLAYVEVKSFGRASSDVYEKFTENICLMFEQVLDISQDKIYIKYEEAEYWGWNGKNF